ncbi:MAG: hypothetical protein HKP01_05075 [Gemmatimonadetes bacterium]|nr:hypothetical protein [Gemmatimonadota bacterium]
MGAINVASRARVRERPDLPRRLVIRILGAEPMYGELYEAMGLADVATIKPS